MTWITTRHLKNRPVRPIAGTRDKLTTTTYKQFEMAERLERLAEEIYQLLASRFPEGSGGHRLFSGLATEEQQHQQRVAMVRRRLLSDSNSVGSAQLDYRRAVDVLERIEVLRDNLAASSDIPLAKAIELAVGLEQDLGLAHAHMVTPDCDPGLRAFLLALAEQDRAHAAVLAGAAAQEA